MLYLIIVLMAAVTIVPRILPVGFLAEASFPRGLERWLRMVPVSILSAMLAVEVLWRDGSVQPGLSNAHVPATLAAAAVAVLTRSIPASAIAGMATLAILRAIC